LPDFGVALLAQRSTQTDLTINGITFPPNSCRVLERYGDSPVRPAFDHQTFVEDEGTALQDSGRWLHLCALHDLVYRSIHNVVATSATLGLPIEFVDTLANVLYGWGEPGCRRIRWAIYARRNCLQFVCR
jgi:hypothetical protein